MNIINRIKLNLIIIFLLFHNNCSSQADTIGKDKKTQQEIDSIYKDILSKNYKTYLNDRELYNQLIFNKFSIEQIATKQINIENKIDQIYQDKILNMQKDFEIYKTKLELIWVTITIFISFIGISFIGTIIFVWKKTKMKWQNIYNDLELQFNRLEQRITVELDYFLEQRDSLIKSFSNLGEQVLIISKKDDIIKAKVFYQCGRVLLNDSHQVKGALQQLESLVKDKSILNILHLAKNHWQWIINISTNKKIQENAYSVISEIDKTINHFMALN